MIGRIIVGVLIAALGWFMVWKTEWFLSMLGYIEWAERHLGGGGTRTFYKLGGIAVILIGLMVITNLFTMFMTSLVRGLFG